MKMNNILKSISLLLFVIFFYSSLFAEEVFKEISNSIEKIQNNYNEIDQSEIEATINIDNAIKEVDSIFKLPLDFLMDNDNHEVDNKLYDNGNTSYNYNFNVINYDNHYIWGATASILLNLYEKLK